MLIWDYDVFPRRDFDDVFDLLYLHPRNLTERFQAAWLYLIYVLPVSFSFSNV
jgi:hypothetical protein